MPSENPTPVIEFSDVSFHAGQTQVLRGLTLQVAKGETLILLGRSGSGKTTTLKLINALVSPSSGEVLVNGATHREVDVIRLRRGIVFPRQVPGLSDSTVPWRREFRTSHPNAKCAGSGSGIIRGSGQERVGDLEFEPHTVAQCPIRL